MGRFKYEFSNLCGSVHRGGNLVFSPDGNTLYSAVGGRLSGFDLVGAKSFTMPFECRSDICALDVSCKDGRSLIVVDQQNRALLVNIPSRTVVHRFTLRDRVRKNALKFSPCQKYFAVVSARNAPKPSHSSASPTTTHHFPSLRHRASEEASRSGECHPAEFQNLHHLRELPP